MSQNNKKSREKTSSSTNIISKANKTVSPVIHKTTETKSIIHPTSNVKTMKPIQVIPTESDSDGEKVKNESDEDVDYDDPLDSDSDDDEGDDESDSDDDDEFERQSSSDSDISDADQDQDQSDMSDSDGIEDLEVESKLRKMESKQRDWITKKSTIESKKEHMVGISRAEQIEKAKQSGELQRQKLLHVDDLSSDDEGEDDYEIGDGEEGKNTVGRIPLHWYDAYDHIGYSITGKKLIKRKGKDRIDMALSANNPMASRTVYDMYNDREVILSDRDLQLIRRMKAGAFPHPEHDAEPEYIDYYSSIIEPMPISAAPEPKRRFLPSKWEMMKVMKIVKAMKEGRYVDAQTKRKQLENSKELYMIWNDIEDDIIADSKRYQYHLPAPKIPLPGHAESYNPPIEYLLTTQERKEQEELDPKDRQYNFIPQKYSCLRHVPGYANFVKERFERCLDLYLCPRKLKRRLNIDPETLVPKLPKPRDLKPYPNSLTLQFLGHHKAIRSISISPDGQYIVSGSDDGTVRLWEVDTALCRQVWMLSKENPVIQVSWNPNPSHHIVAAVVGCDVILITTGTGDSDSTEVTNALLEAIEEDIHSQSRLGTNILFTDTEVDDDTMDQINDVQDDKDSHYSIKTNRRNIKSKDIVTWSYPILMDSETFSTSITQSKVSQNENKSKTIISNNQIGPRVKLTVKADITYMAWHYKGDYLATLAPTLGHQAIAIHQLSKAKSQCPFTKSPGTVECITFHPSRPFIFIVTQQYVKVYHLVEQKLMKKLLSGCKWISCVDIHPSGDHLIIGSYDRRVVWFDLDLSSTPYKTLKFHEKAIRNVQYHRSNSYDLSFFKRFMAFYRRYPLMASASDDGTVHIFHSMVYSDLSKNALIVPLKVLRGHGVKGDLGVLSTVFHPRQPWIFSGGADGIINLYQDL